MRDGLPALLVYAVAAAVYVTLGVFFPWSVLSIVEGYAFLLLAVFVLPLVVARLRR